MAQKIILKNSSVASRVPNPGDLDLGEMAINTTDGKLFIKKGDGSVIDVTGGAGGGVSLDVMSPSNRLMWTHYSTQTWTVPAGVTQVRLVVIGAGGAGNKSSNSSSRPAGGGAYSEGIYTVQEGEVLTAIIGYGPLSVNSTSAGSSGQSSSVSSSINGALLTAGGGPGAANTTVVGTAATASGGTLFNNNGGYYTGVVNNYGMGGSGSGTWIGAGFSTGTTNANVPIGPNSAGWFDIHDMKLTPRVIKSSFYKSSQESGIIDGEGGAGPQSDASAIRVQPTSGGFLAGGGGGGNIAGHSGASGGNGGGAGVSDDTGGNNSKAGDGVVIIYW